MFSVFTLYDKKSDFSLFITTFYCKKVKFENSTKYTNFIGEIIMDNTEQIIYFAGQRIRTVRRESNINLRQLALLTGISAPALSLIENGKRDPRLSTLSKIAKALRVEISAFTDKPTEEPLIVPDTVQGYVISSF